MSDWKKVKLGDILIRSKIQINIENDRDYKRVTIRTKHQGVSARDIERGKKIGTKKQFILKTGQFVMSKIDARYGAFGIAGDDVDSAIITGNFWAYDINVSLASAEWIKNYTNSPDFYDLCERASSGVTHRKYLDEKKFLAHQLMIPPFEQQLVILGSFKKSADNIKFLMTQNTVQSSYASLLRQSILQEAIEGKLTADWRKSHPVIKGDPNTDAEALLAEIEAEKQKLIVEGKIKKEKLLAPIKASEMPFEIPEGWVWDRLGDFLNFDTGKLDSNAAKDGGKYPFFTCAKEPLSIDNYAFDCEAVLLAGNNAAGKYNVKHFVGKFNAYQRTYVITVNYSSALPSFYKYIAILLENKLVELQEKSLGSLTQYLTLGILKPLLAPIPPLVEQGVIVERIEKILSMIDDLDNQVTKRKIQAEDLMQAVLREAFEG